MNPPEIIKFKVNGEYENEKGVFRVISIKKNDMVIRWEDGEQIQTTVELQRKIAERRQQEEYYRLNKKKTTKKGASKSSSKKKKQLFAGFADSDFKDKATGTSWRNQSQLGSAVVQNIDAGQFKFNSWAIGSKPEMHVMDVDHHLRRPKACKAMFFVRVDTKALFYGFSISQPEDNKETSADWETFINWLGQNDNEQKILKIAVQDKLVVYHNTKHSSSGTLLPSDSGWYSEKQSEKQTLADFISGTKGKERLNLEFAASVDKSEAIACAHDIGINIAQLFTRLLPVYHGSVTQRS